MDDDAIVAHVARDACAVGRPDADVLVPEAAERRVLAGHERRVVGVVLADPAVLAALERRPRARRVLGLAAQDEGAVLLLVGGPGRVQRLPAVGEVRRRVAEGDAVAVV
ncbi:MAG TPA: hypothetical protein VFS43_27275, partial [Polyangiaceae bacterium]|nr:hypothetical protein [Polyangiaceae bacterium]